MQGCGQSPCCLLLPWVSAAQGSGEFVPGGRDLRKRKLLSLVTSTACTPGAGSLHTRTEPGLVPLGHLVPPPFHGCLASHCEHIIPGVFTAL